MIYNVSVIFLADIAENADISYNFSLCAISSSHREPSVKENMKKSAISAISAISAREK